MTKIELFKRYIVFMIAVSLGGVGVALFTKGAIGVTPISSLNYVISLHCPLSLGGTTFVFNMVLIVIQYLMFPKNERRGQIIMLLAQIPVSFIFAATIDAALFALESLVPASWNTYAWSVFWVLAGSVTLSLGISLQVLANVAMVSGEAVVKQISSKFKWEFGYVKLGFDLTLVFLAVVTSLVCTDFGRIDGIREGSVAGALLVGPLVRFFRPRMGFVNLFFYSASRRQSFKSQQIEASAAFMGGISIAREAGLGSHIIGKALAQKLNIKLYDSALIDMIAQESGLEPQEVAKKAEHLESSLLHNIIFADHSVPLTQSMSRQDELFVATARVMRNLARQESCIFIGYNGDFILKDNPRNLRVFLYASNLDFKCDYCRETLNLEREQAIAHMTEVDHLHEEHHQYYTNADFKDPSCYDLCLDVSVLGREACIELILQAYKHLQAHPKASYIHKSYTIGHQEDQLLNQADQQEATLHNHEDAVTQGNSDALAKADNVDNATLAQANSVESADNASLGQAEPHVRGEDKA